MFETGHELDGDESIHYIKENGVYNCDYEPAVITEEKTMEWYKKGKLHRDGAPAVIYKNGSEEWWNEGVLHRENGPAVIEIGESKEWYHHGELHRLDGPAIEYDDGGKEWWIEGELHREKGPAIIYEENFCSNRKRKSEDEINDEEDNCGGYTMYYKRNKIHRDEDKPSIIAPDGTKEWYKNDIIHRDGDKPAIVVTDENDEIELEEWYKDGKLHRDDDKPASIKTINEWNGHIKLERWYKKGTLHRDDNKPAIFQYFVNFSNMKSIEIYEAYYKNGKLHRYGKDPAVTVFSDDDELYENPDHQFYLEDEDYVLYYKNGVKYSSSMVEKMEKLREKNLKKISLKYLRLWFDKTYENTESEGFKARMKREIDSIMKLELV